MWYWHAVHFLLGLFLGGFVVLSLWLLYVINEEK